MKALILFFMFIGIIMIIKDQQATSCSPPRVEYRYIPRSFEEQELQSPSILTTYGDLFTKASPWESSIGYPGIYYNKKEMF